MQIAFFAAEFVDWMALCQFVHHFEAAGGRGDRASGGVEGWLPIAALIELKYLALTGHVPRSIGGDVPVWLRFLEF